MQIRSSVVGLALLLTVASAASTSAQLLTLVEKETAGDLAGVGAVALSPGGGVMLAASSNSHSLVSYLRDAETGAITFADQEIDGEAGVDGLRTAVGVAFSPDGLFAYVASRGDSAVSVFSVDAETGALGFVQTAVNELAGVDGIWQNRGVAVSPDGSYVVGSGRKAPAQPKGALALFTRDATSGAISYVDAAFNDEPGGATLLAQGGTPFFSPDGSYVYVASTNGAAVVVFSIDSSTDTLVFEGEIANGGAITGLGGASSIAFSADGAHAYVTGSTANAVTQFSRDNGTGALTFVATHADGAGGIDGLAGAYRATLNAAGNRLFVSGPADDAIAVFARANDGTLLFIGLGRDGVDGLDGLAGAQGIAISPDDDFLYVAASGEAALGAFERGAGGAGDAFDFGDAPDPSFPTLLASDGARHAITDGALRLGVAMDSDADGQPEVAAAGDDQSIVDDEDGVVFLEPFVPSLPADIEVTASAAGLLDAWVDWNADGDWSDAGERFATAAPMAAGANIVTATVSAATPPDAFVMARFRLSTAGVASFDGLAADGEVEDYRTATGRGADLSATPSAEVTVSWVTPFTLVQTIGNIGPNDVVGAEVTIELSGNAGAVTWTCVATNGTCTAGGAGDVADLVDLAPGGTLVYTFSGTVPNEAPGPFIEATATVTPPAGTTDPVAANDSAIARVRIYQVFLDGFETGDTIRWSAAQP